MFRTKRLSDLIRLCLLAATTAWAFTSGSLVVAAQDFSPTAQLSNPNPNNWDTKNIMQAIRHPHGNLTILSAHRGLHALAARPSQAVGVPENSLQAIALAAQAGWEVIEIDVRLTSDKVPILTHDKTWGREWCGLSPVPANAPYDPFTPPGSYFNDNANPSVDSTTLSNTRSFLGNTVLRDSVSLVNLTCSLKFAHNQV